MSDKVTAKGPEIAARERTLSTAAAKHLLSKGGGNASLSQAMGSEAKRIKDGWDARAAKEQPDLVLRSQDGRFVVVEVKGGGTFRAFRNLVRGKTKKRA